MNKERFIFISFVFSFVFLPLSTSCLLGLTPDEAGYEKGIEYIDKFYDSGSAIQELNTVIVSETASPELKMKAYFWLADVYLFEGKVGQARQSLSNMFKLKPDPNYDFTNQLSESITKNKELISLFAEEKEKSFGKQIKKKKIIRAKHKVENTEWEKRVVYLITSLIYVSALVIIL